MLPGYAGNQYILDLNGDAGAFISVLAKSTVRRLIVTESPLTSTGGANTLQGLLEYKIPNDNTPQGFTTIFMQAGANDLTSQGSVGLAQIVLGGDRTEAVDRDPGRRRDVDVCHVCPAFPKFVLAGRTLRESPDPAIRGITHWSTHSPSAWVLIDGSRRARRWPRRRSGCGCGARAWSGCAGRGSRPSARRRTGSGRSACWSVPARPAGPPRARGG